ncbi:MAG: hypothetical protein KC589_09625 [Nanoarchaeota archaeon]|nr:hypothetical protein [Nanoarchaeota archaeon]
MSLDILYSVSKLLIFPINSREQLLAYFNGVKIHFEGNVYDGRDIATMITKYPIKKSSKLIELFIEAAHDDYNLSNIEKKEFANIEA